MGYYTYYTVQFADASYGRAEEDHQWLDVAEDTEQMKKLREICGYDISFEEEQKWYEMESEMVELSKEFYDNVFRVWADGESSDDMAYHYFYRGRQQTCQGSIVYPDMNYYKMRK